MKKMICAMHDRVSNAFGPMTEVENDAVAQRSFIATILSGVPDYILRDSELIQFAEVDASGSTPVVTPLQVPRTVFRGTDFDFQKIRDDYQPLPVESDNA